MKVKITSVINEFMYKGNGIKMGIYVVKTSVGEFVAVRHGEGVRVMGLTENGTHLNKTTDDFRKSFFKELNK